MQWWSLMATTTLPQGQIQPVFRMLGDVVVLDLTTSIAGPYASMLLSDFGAEVRRNPSV